MSKNEGISNDPQVLPPSPYTEVSKAGAVKNKLAAKQDETVAAKNNAEKAGDSYWYDPRQKTFLGRDSYKWLKLAAFYTVFYFCLGCFFTGLLWIFAGTLDREKPRYYDRESTMSSRTTASLLGMGFRPQPVVDDSLIPISNDPNQQKIIASSLRLYRDHFLLQKSDPKTEECTDAFPASQLLPGTACSFNWYHIVNTPDHPCSDNNMYGFKNEEPCVLIKLNKIYDWIPPRGRFPPHVQRRLNMSNNRTVQQPNVYITCDGSNPSDSDAIRDVKYYSLGNTRGTENYGFIPNYYFPFRNAPDHVQPFVLVQFKNLPLNRLLSVTCRTWVPDIEHDTRTMRGMVTFQLYRSHVEQAPPNNQN